MCRKTILCQNAQVNQDMKVILAWSESEKMFAESEKKRIV